MESQLVDDDGNAIDINSQLVDEDGNPIKTIEEKPLTKRDAWLPRVSKMEKNNVQDIPVNPNAPKALELGAANALRKPLAWAMDILSVPGRAASSLAKAAESVNEGTANINTKEGQESLAQDIRKWTGDTKGSNFVDNTIRHPSFIPSLALGGLVGPSSTVAGGLSKLLGASVAGAGVNQLDQIAQGEPGSVEGFKDDLLLGLATGAGAFAGGKILSGAGKSLMGASERKTLRDLGYGLEDVPADLERKLIQVTPDLYTFQKNTKQILDKYGKELDIKPGTKPEIIFDKFAQKSKNTDGILKTIIAHADMDPKIKYNVSKIDMADKIIDPVQKTLDDINLTSGITPAEKEAQIKLFYDLHKYAESLNKGNSPLTLWKLNNFKENLVPKSDVEKKIFPMIQKKVDDIISGQMPLTKENLSGINASYNDFKKLSLENDELNKIMGIMNRGKVKEKAYLNKLTEKSNLENITNNFDVSRPGTWPIAKQFGNVLSTNYRLGQAGKGLGNLMQMISPTAGNQIISQKYRE